MKERWLCLPHSNQEADSKVEMSRQRNQKSVPLWMSISYTLMVCVIAPIYFKEYGAGNFLWFSDIAMFVMVPALWFRSSLLTSMMAIGVLPLEIPWLISFLSGGTILNLADYMFDSTLPLYLRALSLFHFPMPACIIYMLWRFGYNTKALYPQMALSVIILLLTRVLTSENENINRAFPPEFLHGILSPNAYLFSLMLLLILGVIIPMHLLLKKYVPLNGR